MTRDDSAPVNATFGQRLLAFLVDSLLCVAIAIVSGRRPGEAGYGLVVYGAFLAIEFLFVATVAQTPGMRVVKIAVVRATDGGRARPGWVLLRTILLAAVVPAVIPDGNGRAMHDRAAGTATIALRRA